MISCSKIFKVFLDFDLDAFYCSGVVPLENVKNTKILF
jgi:hypothetical protein